VQGYWLEYSYAEYSTILPGKIPVEGRALSTRKRNIPEMFYLFGFFRLERDGIFPGINGRALIRKEKASGTSPST
jgi:hypothetical protein